MAAAGTVRVQIEARFKDGARLENFTHALAKARVETKRQREQARHLDRALAQLEEATFALLGIGYERKGKEQA